MVPHVLTALGRTHDPANVATAVRTARERRLRIVQPRPHLRRGRRKPRRLEAHPGRCARARAPARECVCAHGRSRVRRSPTRPNAIPTTTIKRTSTSWRTDAFEQRRDSTRTRSRTGRVPGSSAGTTCCTGRKGAISVWAALHTRIVQGSRWWNVRTPERYIEAIAAGRSPEAGSETLDAETRRLERLQLALRTRATECPQTRFRTTSMISSSETAVA